MADFIAYVANCLIWGEHELKCLSLSLENKNITILQNPFIINENKLRDKFHGYFVKSTIIKVADVELNEVDEVKKIIRSLCNLLSFITCSEVVFYGQKYPRHTSYWNGVGKTNIYHPLVEIKDGKLVREFIETTWNKFRQIEQSRELWHIFDYIHHAIYPGPKVESKLVFSFITLESLKYTYAINKPIPSDKRGFLKPNKRKLWFFRSNKKKYYRFEELLDLMLKEVGIINTKLKSLVKLRNEIIHSGLSKNDFSTNFRLYKETQNLIREYLIKLLGYNGYYRKL